MSKFKNKTVQNKILNEAFNYVEVHSDNHPSGDSTYYLPLNVLTASNSETSTSDALPYLEVGEEPVILMRQNQLVVNVTFNGGVVTLWSNPQQGDRVFVKMSGFTIDKDDCTVHGGNYTIEGEPSIVVQATGRGSLGFVFTGIEWITY